MAWLQKRQAQRTRYQGVLDVIEGNFYRGFGPPGSGLFVSAYQHYQFVNLWCMEDFITSTADFIGSILAMIGAIALFIMWGHFSEKRYEEADEAKKKKISERRGVFMGITVLVIISLVVVATISAIFF